jgi:glucosamine-6-phosphate deaminase
MRVIIEPSYELVSRWAANHVAKRIKEFGPGGSKRFVLGLPTGSSPLGMYKELMQLNKAAKVSFKNVITFNMDEYVNIAQDHPESYHSFMWNNFFGHVDIAKENVNILNGNAADLGAECVSSGIGPDGHRAFNEPGSSLSSRTRVMGLTYDTIVANSRFFDNDINKVPKTALTVGVGTVMDAKEVMIIVNGHNKARALRHAIEGSLNHMWTVSALQMHPQGIIVCDDEATSELRVGTVKYFRDIESANLDPATLLP